MYVVNAVIVFGSCALGCLVTWLASKALVAWQRRRNADSQFQRSLALGGTLTETGEKTGVHAKGVKVWDIVKREAQSEITMDFPGRRPGEFQ